MSYKSLWQGRIDAEDGLAGRRWHQVVEFPPADFPSDSQGLCLLGYPNDAGVEANKGRPGASGGPEALRRFLANLPWSRSGSLWDLGDVAIQPQLKDTQQAYANQLTTALAQHCVLGLGGGHDIAWGSYQGLIGHLGTQANVGIINFDAHLDLRKPAPFTSSGTPFRQIAEWNQQQGKPFHYACLGASLAANTPALFDYAKQSETRVLLDTEFSFETAVECLHPMLDQVDHLYVTVCMDAFPASIAPGVSAPAGLGICPQTTVRIIQWLGHQCQQRDLGWRLADIAELNPAFDFHGCTARLASRIGFELANAMRG